jgi:membrane peptidoglycan carboxypeptidase
VGGGRTGTAYREPGYDDGGNGYGGSGSRALRRPGQVAPGRRLPGRGGGGPGGGSRGGRGGGRIRRKGDWWRHWTVKKGLAVAAAGFGAVMIIGAAFVGYEYSRTQIPTQAALDATAAASTVYFSDGKTEVGQFGTISRQDLTYSQIPQVMQNAILAAEDRNFWHEGGISPTGILRALYYDLRSSGGSLQGGSTITQELVKNYYANIGSAQTLRRKIKEIFVAQKLAGSESKQWILTQYLNTVPFGHFPYNAYGLGAAAQEYFGLDPAHLSQLTPSQAAMLAAMVQLPGYFDPSPKAGAPYQALVARWNYVLDGMVKMGALPPQERAKATFPKVIPPPNNSWSGYTGFIMQKVEYELENPPYNYSRSKIENGGLHIVTTFSKSLMDSLYGTVAHDEKLMKAGTPPTPPYNSPFAACPAVKPRYGCLPPYVNVGAMLIQPGTGNILAMYSGPDYAQNKWDMALQARNQVGSSFKPYVLATAVQQGMSVQTSQLPGWSPLWIPPDSQPAAYASLQQPAASAGWFQIASDESVNPNRPVSIYDATAMSLNTSYADLWHRVALMNGQHAVTQMAQSFGVDPAASGMTAGPVMQDEAGIALGQASLTVAEQANMIATLAANGEYSTPHVVAKIIDPVTGAVTMAKVDHHQVLTPTQAAEVDWAMSGDTGPIGTADGLGLTNGQEVIAKTGTTNLAQSAFFLGATPRYAMAVGMFVNKPSCTLPKSEQSFCTSTSALSYQPPAGLQTLFGVGHLSGYGGQWPAIIWHDFFNANFDSVPVQAFPAPDPTYGSTWNLVGPNMMPKPKKSPAPCPGPGPGHGRGGHCPPGGTTGGAGGTTGACPVPLPVPVCATPSPKPAAYVIGGAPSGGVLAAAAIMVLPVRLRGRRLSGRRLRRRRRGPPR